MLIFRDIEKSFKLVGGLLKTMTIYKFNVGHSNPQDIINIMSLDKK